MTKKYVPQTSKVRPPPGPIDTFNFGVTYDIFDAHDLNVSELKVLLNLKYWSKPCTDGSFDRLVRRGYKAQAADLTLSLANVKTCISRLLAKKYLVPEVAGTKPKKGVATPRAVYRIVYKEPSAHILERLSKKQKPAVSEKAWHRKTYSVDKVLNVYVPPGIPQHPYFEHACQPTKKAIGTWANWCMDTRVHEMQTAILMLDILLRGGVQVASPGGYIQHLLNVVKCNGTETVKTTREVRAAYTQARAEGAIPPANLHVMLGFPAPEPVAEEEYVSTTEGDEDEDIGQRILKETEGMSLKDATAYIAARAVSTKELEN